jgi:transcriptional/translational regulatory protein YebC/TACO1
MRDRLTCGALLYGYTMDLEGSTAVAERYQCPGLNEALDTVITRALARDLPSTLINHATGGHGFDLDQDREGTSVRFIPASRAHPGVTG